MKKLLFITITFLITYNLFAQVRGWNPGELFVTTDWYRYELEGPYYRMVLFTVDNGKTFTVKYLFDVLSDELEINWVWADKTPGVVYGRTDRGLYRSDDNCLTWTFIKDIPMVLYSTGNIQGEIYRREGGRLYWSSNYAEEFEEKNNSIIGFCRVGNQQGEIYNWTGEQTVPLTTFLSYSNNYGETFETWQVDTTVSGYNIEQNYPTISAGTEPGELYFVSIFHPGHYHIYHSLDYGHTFTLQYVQPDTIYGEGYSFTAGREPGSFYVVVKEPAFDYFNTRLTIYYSSDYAQTFTKYVHILDTAWTGTAIQEIRQEEIEFYNYPNPFTNSTNIYIEPELLLQKPVIEIFNSAGQIIDIIKPDSNNNIIWNATSKNQGIYYYRVKTTKTISKCIKMILLK